MKKTGFVGTIAILALLISGCSVRDRTKADLVFIDDSTVEISTNFNTCSLVASVEGIAILPSMVDSKNHTIALAGGKEVKCNQDSFENKLGKQTVSYTYNRNIYELVITLVDTTAPVIEAKEEYVVKLNNEYFNIESVVSVSDNSGTEIMTALSGTYDLSKVGEYQIIYKAVDQSRNEATQAIKISVVDGAVEDDYQEIPQGPQTPPVNGNDSPSVEQPPSVVQPAPSEPEPPASNNNGGNTGEKPQQRTFTFTEGEAPSVQMNACMAYLTQAAQNGFYGIGNCIVLKDTTTGLNVGYKAVFD